MSNNPSSLDVKTSSEDSLQLKSDMGSSFPELAMKVRKAYTITKQRERWTEEEHNRFLEALKLYGRAWRQIEEHIGTKTAVQIRSHAQKFFTKVSRESAGESSGEVKSIEIPPPRPKRKPMHPYPRKLGNSPGISVTEKPEWPLVPKFSVPGQDSIQIPKQSSPEQDNMSPTSVLSAVGSDAFGSSASEIVNNSSTSPASSGDGSDPIGTSGSGQDYVCQSAMTSVEEEDKSVMPHKFDMELDVFTDDSISCKEASPTQTLTSSLKLFGKTVTVADSQKSLSSTTKNHSEQNGNDEALPSGEGTSNWKSWPNGVTPMFYFLPSHGNLSSSSAVSMFPMPWVFYQDAPSTMTNPQSVSSEQEQLPYCREEVADIGEVHNGWRPSKTSAFRSLKATTKKPAKGFVPYKRCVGDKKVDNQMMVNDNGDGQGVQLCL